MIDVPTLLNVSIALCVAAMVFGAVKATMEGVHLARTERHPVPVRSPSSADLPALPDDLARGARTIIVLMRCRKCGDIIEGGRSVRAELDTSRLLKVSGAHTLASGWHLIERVWYCEVCGKNAIEYLEEQL